MKYMKTKILLLIPIFGMSQELPPQVATKSSGAECNGLLFSAKITNCPKTKLSCYNLYIDASCDGKAVNKNINIYMDNNKVKKSINIENDLKQSKNKNFAKIAVQLEKQRQYVTKEQNQKLLAESKNKIIAIQEKLTPIELQKLELLIKKYR